MYIVKVRNHFDKRSQNQIRMQKSEMEIEQTMLPINIL